MGVTGMRDGFGTDFDGVFSMLNKFTDMPKCLGFGISKPKHIEGLKHYCDGLIAVSYTHLDVYKRQGLMYRPEPE